MTSTGKSVLVVEDHEDTREMVEMFLQHDGYRVRTAAHGLQALDSIAHELPCLVLLDLTMPVMDGLTFARRLRAHPNRQAADVPIVLLTALPDARQAMLEIGAVEVIEKPISFERVISVVERACCRESARPATGD